MDMLESLGVLHVAKVLTRQYPRILMYHRFAADNVHRRLGAADFERHLNYLKQEFNVMPLAQMARMLAAGHRLPANAVAITIDDGCQDFYQYAWPLLRKYELPSTLYVVTGFISGDCWLWPDELRYIIWNSTSPELRVENTAWQFCLPLKTADDREIAWGLVADHCLLLPNDERLALLQQLKAVLNVDVPSQPVAEFRPMSWEQIVEVSRHGVDIGAHSMTHPRLTSLNGDVLMNEVRQSKAVIEQKLQSSISSFCYPNGTARDYDQKVIDAVRACGFENATVGFFDAHVTDNLYALRRLSPGSDFAAFKRMMSGVSLLKLKLTNAYHAD